MEEYLKAVELLDNFINLFSTNWTKEDARRCALVVVENMKKDTHKKEYWNKVEHHLMYL